jgi:hypothetical protein
MSRKIGLSMVFLLVLAGLVSARGGPPALPPVSPELRTYAAELSAAFPGQVDLYLVGKEFVFAQPSIVDARIVGCSQITGVLYYVVLMSNKSETFIPQSQIVAIHNHKQ